jgi:hypothetical protein
MSVLFVLNDFSTCESLQGRGDDDGEGKECRESFVATGEVSDKVRTNPWQLAHLQAVPCDEGPSGKSRRSGTRMLESISSRDELSSRIR